MTLLSCDKEDVITFSKADLQSSAKPLAKATAVLKDDILCPPEDSITAELYRGVSADKEGKHLEKWVGQYPGFISNNAAYRGITEKLQDIWSVKGFPDSCLSFVHIFPKL